MQRPMTKMGTRLSGHFDYTQPEAYDPDIREVSHALANLCRFTGHVPFFSVAQHSVLLSRIVPNEHAFAALMRNAHKAYVGELTGPLKALLPDYRAIERRVAAAVRERYALAPTTPLVVEQINDALTLTEAMRFGIPARDFPQSLKPLQLRIEPQQPGEAQRAFVQRYRELAPAVALVG